MNPKAITIEQVSELIRQSQAGRITYEIFQEFLDKGGEGLEAKALRLAREYQLKHLHGEPLEMEVVRQFWFWPLKHCGKPMLKVRIRMASASGGSTWVAGQYVCTTCDYQETEAAPY